MIIFRKRNGFTLTELCVVMAVVAIIAAMVTTTLIFVSQQNSDIQKESNFIAEVTDVQSRVNDWLKKYDNNGYSITYKSDQTTLIAESETGSDKKIITFSESEKVIKADGVKISDTYKNISGITFKVIGDVSDAGGRVVQIKIKAKKGSGTESQTLLFPLFSSITRERSVTGKNG